RARLSRSDSHPRRHGHGRRPHGRRRHLRFGAVRVLLRGAAEVCGAVQGEEDRRSVPRRRRRGRRVARLDQHRQRDARDSRSLAWYLFSLFVVVSTVLWGRLYCGRVCAFGALTQLMDAIVPARFRVDLPRKFEQRAAWTKYVVLAVVMVYFVGTRDVALPVRY